MIDTEAWNGIDYTILTIISISVLLGVIRGFVREAISLITWVTAITLGILYCDEIAMWFSGISISGIRVLLAFVLIVLSVLIVGGIINYLITTLIRSTKFTITDRIVGTLFGFARGSIIVAILILLVNPMITSEESIWKKSILVAKFEPISQWMKEKFPEDLLKIYKNPRNKEKKKSEEHKENNLFNF